MFEGNRVVAHTGSRYPIIQAPMTWAARAPLVAAVSAAGAMGLLETSSLDIEVSSEEFRKIRATTDQPFGVNLLVRRLKTNPEMEGRILDWLLESGIRFVTTSAGDPTRYARLLKDAGFTVYHAVPTLEAALKAVDAGVDGLTVEGAESAGVRNPEQVHSFVLLQAVREKVDVPIVAAGGIVDGRGMAAAFALGAEGVAMGTRFLTSRESPVHPAYKAAVVAAPPSGTMINPRPPGAIFRTLKTPRAIGYAAGTLPQPGYRDLVEMLYIGGDVDNTTGAAGESAGLIHEVRPVADIVQSTIDGFWREIDRLSALRPASRVLSPAE
jgi:enoyl-[acyl-carrier protein] reductase II